MAWVGAWRSCKKCKCCGVEPGSSCLALPGAGQSPGRSPRPRRLLSQGLHYVKGGGRDRHSWNLSIHCGGPAASRCHHGGGCCGLLGEMRIAAQHAVDRTNRFLGPQPPGLGKLWSSRSHPAQNGAAAQCHLTFSATASPCLSRSSGTLKAAGFSCFFFFLRAGRGRVVLCYFCLWFIFHDF